MTDLQGEGFWLSVAEDQMVFHVEASGDVQFGDGSRVTLSGGYIPLALPASCCESLAAGPLEGGGAALTFQFRLPTTKLGIRVTVGNADLGRAEIFVGRLRRAYPGMGFVDLFRQPPPAPAPAPPAPAPDPRVREDWVSAPVSQETFDLYSAVMARLISTDA
ncbi:hypothetical protein [Streptomyces sp. 6N223]|uniref:hypothetical protein n=1 Tax=Streptomyces sp. 6N223 TaxID=3457412 RepID=UPI003FD1D923